MPIWISSDQASSINNSQSVLQSNLTIAMDWTKPSSALNLYDQCEWDGVLEVVNVSVDYKSRKDFLPTDNNT